MNDEPTSEATAADPLEAGKSHALQAAEELRAAAADKARQLSDAAQHRASELRHVVEDKAEHLRDTAGEKADEFRHYAEDTYADARARVDDARTKGEDYIRTNPAKSVLIALGLGFVIGRLLR